MAELFPIGEPVNDGERHALRHLRDELPEDWSVVANFSFKQGSRTFECDALAVGPAGWGYLIEVKAWSGRIRGNDAQWELPPLAGDKSTFRACPLSLIEQKSKALASLLRDGDTPLKNVFIAPMIVLVSKDEPDLKGRCADATRLLHAAGSRVLTDPRPHTKKPPTVPPDAVSRIVAVLTRDTRPMAPAHVAGTWDLVELVESGPSWEVWSARARLAGAEARLVRFKKYALDSLLAGEERKRQHDCARRDLEALERLSGADGAVPPVSTVEEDGDSFLVVTDWPDGEALSSLITAGISSDAAEEIFEALVTALASVHRAGIVHRHLSPDCAHCLADGRIVLTDFDYARIPAAASITKYIADELASPFTAPEVARDPTATSKAADVWSVGRIGLALLGVEEASEAPARLRAVLQRTLASEPEERPADAEILLTELRGEADGLFGQLEPNDELEDRWVVRSHPVAEGGLARVYKVFDTLSERDYAAKFVKAEYRSVIDPAKEYQLLLEVPDHPGIVKPEIPQKITHFRRGTRQHELHDVFVPTRWIEGPRLDQLLSERLPIERCIELLQAICGAVAHLHEYKLLHRDLKPQNIIVEQPSGEPRVVDFNVSRREVDAGQTKAGTEPYRPPDLDQTGWSKGTDVYALGVILCELLAGKLLYGECLAWATAASLPDGELRAFLRRAVAPVAADRFEDVEAFLGALSGVQSALLEARSHPGTTDFPEATAEELARPNWNPYQSRLVGLFSQSSTSNAGTRGLDEFGRWAYVETVIDRRLFQDIVAGEHALVVITGNAGDGKTAFIQVLEQRLAKEGALVEQRPEGNGATIQWGDRTFVTNWDGSQDEGGDENDGVLSTFFAPFGGNDPKPAAGETRIIAINEGRLLDFLGDHRGEFPWLSDAMLAFSTQEVVPQADWLAVVNLNLRALTVARDDGSSIVGELLERFSDQRLWQPCEGCVAAEQCYARANAEALRDPVLGGRVSDRLRETLDVARLRRRLHITMRDLRSALAFAVAGNRTCDEIVELVEIQRRQGPAGGPRLQLDIRGQRADAARRRARRAAETTDFLRWPDRWTWHVPPTPGDDARLWTLGADAIRADPVGVSRTDRELLDELRERLPNGTAQLLDRQARADLRLLHASLRRKLYFETEDPGWVRMLPYDRLGDFVRQLKAAPP